MTLRYTYLFLLKFSRRRAVIYGFVFILCEKSEIIVFVTEKFEYAPCIINVKTCFQRSRERIFGQMSVKIGAEAPAQMTCNFGRFFPAKKFFVITARSYKFTHENLYNITVDFHNIL